MILRPEKTPQRLFSDRKKDRVLQPCTGEKAKSGDSKNGRQSFRLCHLQNRGPGRTRGFCEIREDHKHRQNGKRIKPVVEIDKEKIEEDLKYAGYNLMVTSELDMDPLQVYRTYHSLWKIEESFRITKSYLDARPVYVHKKETIYGHFLICYLSLFL